MTTRWTGDSLTLTAEPSKVSQSLQTARLEMKEAQKKLKAERAKVKNANKRKARLIAKVSKLGENELVEALLYKKELMKQKEKRDAGTSSSSQPSASSADEPDAEPTNSQAVGEDLI